MDLKLEKDENTLESRVARAEEQFILNGVLDVSGLMNSLNLMRMDLQTATMGVRMGKVPTLEEKEQFMGILGSALVFNKMLVNVVEHSSWACAIGPGAILDEIFATVNHVYPMMD